MSGSNSSIDYASLEGIHSLAGAIIFTIAYVPLVALYLFKSVRHPTFVHFVLTFFCFIRTIAFILRSVLAGSTSAAHNENLLIAEQVIYQVSFSAMLYSAYTLVLDREVLVDISTIENMLPMPLKIVFDLMRRRMLIRMALSAAVVVGIIGAVDYETATTTSKLNTGTNLRSASVYVFLAVACLLTLNAFILSAATMSAYSQKSRVPDERGWQSFGKTHGILVLLVIAGLILAREAFYAATEHRLSQQNNEKLWYPLSALTEFVAVVLFAVPGLVPARNELPRETTQLSILS